MDSEPNSSATSSGMRSFSSPQIEKKHVKFHRFQISSNFFKNESSNKHSSEISNFRNCIEGCWIALCRKVNNEWLSKRENTWHSSRIGACYVIIKVVLAFSWRNITIYNMLMFNYYTQLMKTFIMLKYIFWIVDKVYLTMKKQNLD